MLLWRPLQFRDVWDTFYAECDEDTKIALDYRLDQLIEKGSLAREPLSKHLDGDIFELRAKNARVLYFFGFDRTIVFVHAIIKKRADVPSRDIALAESRRKLLEEGLEEPHELTQDN